MLDTVIIDEGDIGKDHIDLLMDMIYETNKVRIPREHIKYGTPVPLDQRPDDLTDPNTYIDVQIDPLWDYELSKLSGFMYRRQDLGAYFQDLEITITVSEFPFRVSDIWDEQVLPHLPYPIAMSEMQDYLFTDPDSLELVVYSKSGSYLWSGKVKLVINPIDPTLFELVHNPFLTGFVQYFGPF